MPLIESVPLVVCGDRVALGPLRQRLASVYSQWDADLGLSILRGRDLRPELEGAFEPSVFSEANEPASVLFTIYETIYESKAPRPIGLSKLSKIDSRSQTAELSLFLGERDTWSTGLGTEAARLTLDFAFHALGLHNVEVRLRADNVRAKVSLERAGFRVIGRRRGAIRVGQTTCDELAMDCIASEFEGTVLRATLESSMK